MCHYAANMGGVLFNPVKYGEFCEQAGSGSNGYKEFKETNEFERQRSKNI